MQTLLLYTNNLAAAKTEIEQAGGKISQQFTDQLLAAALPDHVNADAFTASTARIPETLSAASLLAYNAWKRMEEKNSMKDLSPDVRDGLSWDTEGYQSPRDMNPLKIPGEENSEIEESTGTPTSLYMTGSIAVGLVIVSGPGNLAISQPEASMVLSEVQEGLNFLAGAEPRAKISFVYDIQLVQVTAAPGSTAGYESAEAPWRDAALGKMGFTASRQGSIEYVNRLVQTKATNWAYVAYFTKYPLHHFAYAVEEKLVMSYFNASWGTQFINGVFAHETCHIFGAADEYGNCNCNSVHGYLAVSNGNCRVCAPASVECLMDRNKLTLCNWTRKQIGWDERLFPH
jgi:hypothetical protein